MNRRSFVLACLVLLSANFAQAADLAVENAWVRQPPPGTNAAAYLTLANRGAKAVRILGARSEAAERVELHETKVSDGIARMGRVDAVKIEAGQSLVFAPRGLHVMLIQPRALEVGQQVELVFELEGGTTVAVQAEVRAAAPSAKGGHEHHHH